MFASLVGVIPGFCVPKIYVEHNGNVTKVPLFQGSYVSQCYLQYIQYSPRVLFLPCFTAIAHKTMLPSSIFAQYDTSNSSKGFFSSQAVPYRLGLGLYALGWAWWLCLLLFWSMDPIFKKRMFMKYFTLNRVRFDPFTVWVFMCVTEWWTGENTEHWVRRFLETYIHSPLAIIATCVGD